MATAETTTVIPRLPPADTQAVLAHLATGEPVTPAVARRIRERSACITEEIRRQHGVLDIGVPAICELRGAP